MQMEHVQWASVQFEKLNGRHGPAFDQQDGAAWKGIGGVITEIASLPAADSIMTIKYNLSLT